METCSSGEDLLVKARKPYTITKQRERWTDEEHDRFLEAVRLYGRAWQKIEEHVGTKTAIQIRSHAQKFFTKLEKEALSKGLPLGQAHDIDIPPPRPKRKPNNPYPRKTCIAPKLSSGESIFSQYQISVSEKDASLKDSTMNVPCGRVKEIAENSQSSGVFTVMKDAPCTSASSSKGLVSLHLTGEMLPVRNEIHQGSVKKKTSIDENHIAEILINRDIEVNTCTKEGKCENIVGKTFSNKPVDKNKEEKIGKSSENPAQIAQSYPSLFPMPVNGNSNEKHGLDASADPANCTPIPLQAAHSSSNLFAVPSFSALMPAIHGISSFPSCTPFQNNQDGFKFFNDISPSFSDLIVSTLQQNPAVHAAARLAASNWPCSNGNTSLHYSDGSGGTSESSAKNSPNIATIAAATVAAATAWWAIHGLLPFCHPFPVGYSFAPLSMITNAVPESNRTADRKETKAEASFKVPNAQLCDGQIHCHSTNLSPRQSSDTGESGKHKDTNDISAKVPAGKKSSSVEVAGCHDPSSKAKLKKKQYRSSCGSNTPSSSDETEITPEKTNKGIEEVKDMQGHLLNSESINRRSRGCININESWKEVSEEGRLAFQALFSREVLPQSFSPPSEDEVATESDKNNEGDTPFIGLNSKKPWIDDKHDSVQGSENTLLKIASQSTNCLSLGHSDQVKLKTRRTGFKPYKRCFLESRENMTNGEENNAKRIRIEDEASN